MQLYCGARILEAEGEASAPVDKQWNQKEFSKKFPQLHTDLWIDDLSFDVQLEEDNLVISPEKIGFVVPNTTAKRLLVEQQLAHGPQIHDGVRDPGADSTAGRLRRIMTMKVRRHKAARQTRKMQTLKIPAPSIKLRLYKGSVLGGISRGHEAMRLAPQTRLRIRSAMGRQLALQKTGNLDIV